MNVNRNRSPKATRTEQPPEARVFRTPAEVLSLLAPDAGQPEPIRHSGLWKMGPEPQSA